jgi:putative phosphoesterase
MNEIAIISDIHGNLPALEAVLSDIERKNISRVICLGDLVGYYCFYNEVIDIIRQKNIPTLMGNHDYALAFSNGNIGRSKTATMILKKQLTGITRANFNFLKSLPIKMEFLLNKIKIICAHGGPNRYLDQYITEPEKDFLDHFNDDKRTTYFLSGHTHIPKKFTRGCFSYFNPGSIGQPRCGDPRASYLTLSETQATIVKIKYDINKVLIKMKELGYEDYVSIGLLKGIGIGQKSEQ